MKLLPKPVVMVYQLLLIYPVRLSSGGSGRKIYYLSLLLIMCQTVISVEVVVFEGIWLYGRNIPTVATKTVGVLAHCMFAITVFITYSQRFGTILCTYSSLEAVSESLPHKVRSSATGFYVMILYLSGLLFVTLIFQLGTVDTALPGIWLLPLLSQHYRMIAVNYQFHHICQLITECLESVVTEISSLINKDINAKTSSSQHDLPTSNSKDHIRLQALIAVYWRLYDASRHTNAFYSAPLLISIFTSLLQLIIAVYYFFVDIVFNTPSISWAISVGWLGVHIWCLIQPCWSATLMSNQMQQTGTKLCRNINRNMNSKTLKLMESFLVQLRHRKTTLSALNLMPIHNQILTSVTGSAVTYFVFMIQFQDRPENKTSQT